jgi:threonine/homoserine/homoserine lactone efflux protein
MTLDSWIALSIFAIVTSGTPGPNTLMLLASGVNFGFRRSLPHMLGVVSGFCLLLICVGFGLGMLLTAWPPLLLALKLCGGGYLLYLAWRIATAGSLRSTPARPEPMPLVSAMLFQWVNPKAWMMGLTAMALYTEASAPYASVIMITAVFGVVGLPTVALWAGGGSALRVWLAEPVRLRWFNRVMGLLLTLTLLPLLQ